MGVLDSFKQMNQGQAEQTQPQTQPQMQAQPVIPQGGMAKFHEMIAEASEQKRTPFIKPGLYPLLYIDSIKFIQSRKGIFFYIVEFDVLESQVEVRPAGTKMSWMVDFSKDPAPQNVKSFLMKLLDASSEDITPEVSSMSTDKTNPCHGRLIRAEAYDNDKGFTLVNWGNIAKKYQDQSEEIRKMVFKF